MSEYLAIGLFPLLGLALFLLVGALAYNALSKTVLLYGPPKPGQKMWGIVTIPDGDAWSVVMSSGKVTQLLGPTTAPLFGACLTQMQLIVANEKEYIRVQFRDGHSEIKRGPVAVREDTTIHARIDKLPALTLGSAEILVVYRKSKPAAAASATQQPSSTETAQPLSATQPPLHSMLREVVRGPMLYMPECASEYVHEFAWHGHDPSGDTQGLCRKRPNALRFSKLRNAPMQTYIDVENARTNDDALLTIRLMLFFKIESVAHMLDSTNDPIAELLNGVSSDIIEFTSAGSFETFKDSAEQLNGMGVYKNLLERAALIGLSVSKVRTHTSPPGRRRFLACLALGGLLACPRATVPIAARGAPARHIRPCACVPTSAPRRACAAPPSQVVFRGFIAPQRLQKMHDDAIERRTRLVLERETEVQEQAMQNERLSHEQERALVARKMAKEQAAHEAELRAAQFEAEQAETCAAADAKLQQLSAANALEIGHLKKMQSSLQLSPHDVAQILLSKANGPPAKLIQISGAAGGSGSANGGAPFQLVTTDA
jgi:hypothetical protein